MFKQFIHAIDKKLGKFGLVLGLAGVSTTAVACYGPPANPEQMTQKAMARYASMCNGESCEEYCKTNKCAVFGNLVTEPCDREHFQTGLNDSKSIKICNEQWRVDTVQCKDEARWENGVWSCDTVMDAPADPDTTAQAQETTEASAEQPAAGTDPVQNPTDSPRE